MSTNDMQDLDSLIASMSISRAGASNSDIDLLAEKIQERLNVQSFDRQTYRSMATQMLNLSLERRKNGSSTGGDDQHRGDLSNTQNTAHNQNGGISSNTNSAFGGASQVSAFGQMNLRRPDSPRTSFPPQDSTSNQQHHQQPQQPNHSFQRPLRGRSPGRNTSGSTSNAVAGNGMNNASNLRSNTPTRPRSRTPVRSFFGVGGGSGSGKNAPLASDQQAAEHDSQRRRPRSRSPFTMFGSRKAAAAPSVPLHMQQQHQQEHEQQQTSDEKKEFETIWANSGMDHSATTAAVAAPPVATMASFNTSAFANANTNNLSYLDKRQAAAGPTQLSGRESPALDPSADKPSTPSRSSSPVPSSSYLQQQNSRSPAGAKLSPVRAMIDNLNNNIAHTAGTSAAGASTTSAPRSYVGARPASPYSRPGLQEDSDGDADSTAVSQSPSRPSSTRSAGRGRGHSRSNSYTPRLTPKRFKDADDDDESVKQPPMRGGHRKSISDTDALLDVLDIPELRLPHSNRRISGENQSSLSSAGPMGTGGSVGFTSNEDIFAAAVLTPPGQAPEAKTPHYGDNSIAPPNAFKTGNGKMRRKDGTPKAFASAAPTAASSSTSTLPGVDDSANPPLMRPKPFQNNPFVQSANTIFEGSDDSQGSNGPVQFSIGSSGPQRKTHQFRRPSYNNKTNSRNPNDSSTDSFPNQIPPGAGASNTIDPQFGGQQHAVPNINAKSMFSPPHYSDSPHSERALSSMDVDFPGSSPFASASTVRQPPAQQQSLPPVFNVGVGGGGSKSSRATFRRAKDDASKRPGGGQLKAPKPLKPAAVFTSISPASSSETTAASTPSTMAPNARQNQYDEAAAAAAAQMEENERQRMEIIASMRNEARSLYAIGDFRTSIHTYTQAIAMFHGVAPHETNDTLAVLLSNRAACFVMIGAYEVAQSDCQVALKHVSAPSSNGLQESFSNDSGLLLKVKLLTRLARAQLKQGDYKSSQEAFERAIFDANQASSLIKALPPQQSDQLENTLGQMATEANIGLMEVERLREICDKILECTLRESSDEPRYCTEALGHVNMALSVASGSPKLLQKKLTLLTYMKRWREAAGFCERLATSRVPFDGVFVDELESRNPHPGVPPARFLTTSFFADAADEETTDGDMKLNSKSAAEAALRLPYQMMPLYLRALRLEERYPAADTALRALEELVERLPSLQPNFRWLSRERTKLSRTKAERERGDELFRLSDFDLAASQYGSCLLIDGDDNPSKDGGNAGGRLHAVLHCNRAACLMAVRRFHEAIHECAAALRIHSRYMKAMLRRSRCYVRLHRYQEAISEYETWLSLVEEARSGLSPSTFTTPCLFDGPKDVSNADISQVRRELDEVYRSKRRADATARDEASRRRERQTSWDAYSRGASFNDNASTSSAQERRDFWHNRENDSRRWDSFSGRRPHGAGHSRSKSWGEPQDQQQRQQQQQHKKKVPLGSPGSDPSIDHYSVLEIQLTATDEDIKKKYRRLALQYHPDKNKNEGAADKFRRIKLAYETLSDPATRRRYDAELRLDRRI